MAEKSLFSKIIAGEIPAKFLHQDEWCVVIRDIAAQAPQHFLVIPKKEIRSLNEAQAEDQALMGHLLLVAAQVAREQGFGEKGYRLVLNTNDDGGQTVPHIHIHILAGRALRWPPG